VICSNLWSSAVICGVQADPLGVLNSANMMLGCSCRAGPTSEPIRTWASELILEWGYNVEEARTEGPRVGVGSC